MKRILALLTFVSVPFAQQPRAEQPVPVAVPDFRGGPAIDQTIERAIAAGQIPGAVVLVGHNGQIVYHKSYGHRALVPAKEPMTLDTVFDVASLTKVVATTSGMMKLVEQGKIRLDEKVTEYLPEFQGGRSDITVRQLLTHYSGMRPDVDLEPQWSGYTTGIQKALADRPVWAPNQKFVYSDINFLLLGEIIHRVSGQPLPDFVRQQVFEPLHMTDTTFTPAASLKTRIAPTEIVRGSNGPLRGVVHDPTARYMGGVAGHAGLFSTAWDLAKFAQMMLDGGTYKGTRVLSPLTIHAFTTQQSPAGMSDVRGLGWDIHSRFSGSRGDVYPVGSYGHTGFTGTSLWIDPYSNSFVILLTNSGHPKLRPAITPLRARIASAAAAGLNLPSLPPVLMTARKPVLAPVAASTQPQPAAQVLTGLDVLAAQNFEPLRGKRVGLITNHTGITRDGKRNIDVMLAAGVNLKALYSPEHGIAGRADDDKIGHERDAQSGLPVWSLYLGENRRPNEAMLRDIDVLVFDIQDIGTRFYTYNCTMKYAMEEAARRNIAFMVLDRPNPITGVRVEGPVMEPELMSFVGCFALPVRHGMTSGELAQMMNESHQQKAQLTVVKMQNWQRDLWFDATGLTWVNPSPNMRSLTAALLYPGIGMAEYAKVYSVGRGTDAPFEQVGAAWMDGRKLALYLNSRAIPGVRVYPTILKPSASNFSGKTINGVRFVITDREAFNSVRFGTELAVAMEKLFPGQMQWSVNEKLAGSKTYLAAVGKAEDPERIEQQFAAGTEEFRNQRARYLLY